MHRKKFWSNLKPYNLELYQGEALTKLTVVGILKLHNADIDVSFENIMVILYKLFPEKYSLIKFPEYPDSKKVIPALSNHCISIGYIEGNFKKNSFTLTPKGYSVAEDLLDKMKLGTISQRKRSNWKQSKYIRLVKGVSNTAGFKKFSDKHFKEIKKFDVCESLHCTIDADEEHVQKNLEMLMQYANDTKMKFDFTSISESVLQYLQYIESNWEELMK